MIKKLIQCPAFILVFILLSSPAAYAEKATLENIITSNDEKFLMVSFRLTDCFTEEMKKAIDNGIDTAFTYIVRLYEVRHLWWDRKVEDLKIKRLIKYDNLKKVYQIKLPTENDKTIFVKNFVAAKRILSEVIGLRVTELEKLYKGRRYKVQIMAKLDKTTLPFRLHNILFFLSLWDFETDWYTLDVVI
jgi:hypothetical protein